MKSKITFCVLIAAAMVTGDAIAQDESGTPVQNPTPIVQQADPITPAAPAPGDSSVEPVPVENSPVPAPNPAIASDCASCSSVPMHSVISGPMGNCGCTGGVMNYSTGYGNDAASLWSDYTCPGTCGYGRSYGGFWHRPAYRPVWFGRRCYGY